MKKIVCLLVFLLTANAFSEQPQEKLQVKLNDLHSMSAHFQQVVKAKNRVLSNSSGTMALERPGRFRWQTISPMEQLVVADGKKLWIYDTDLEQVTVKKQEKGLGGTAALFLSGYTNSILTEDFNVAETSSAVNSSYDLRSKSSKANFQRVKLIFTKNLLTSIELFDQLGQHTIVHLNHIKRNIKLPARLFQFTPPKGVDIVQQ